ncbi:MAG: SRPBCC domain-containing protein [Pseudomonadota bacterium]
MADMDLHGTYIFHADPTAIWHALFDPKALKSCLPGAKAIEGSVQDGFTAEIEMNFGPMAIALRGAVHVAEMTPFRSVRLKGQGRGLADITLERRGGQTLLSYHMSIHVGGRFGRLGDGVVTNFAKSTLNTFFAELDKLVVDA